MSLETRQRSSLLIAELAAALAVGMLGFAVIESVAHHAELSAVQARAQAEEQRHAVENARRFSAIVAGCLNGEAISDGERIVDCRPRR